MLLRVDCLVNFTPPGEKPYESGWVRSRESQHRAALNNPNAELVVGLGLGEWNDIHPLRKKEMAERASIEIRNKVYSQPVTVTPRLSRGEVSGNKVILTFTDTVMGNHPMNAYFTLKATRRSSISSSPMGCNGPMEEAITSELAENSATSK